MHFCLKLDRVCLAIALCLCSVLAIAQDQPNPRPRVGIALSGGGALGLAQIGDEREWCVYVMSTGKWGFSIKP